jgi:hypothetical protein
MLFENSGNRTATQHLVERHIYAAAPLYARATPTGKLLLVKNTNDGLLPFSPT